MAFQFKAQIDHPDGQIQTIQTDESWKGISSPYLKNAALPADVEKRLGNGNCSLFDAEAGPVGWQLHR